MKEKNFKKKQALKKAKEKKLRQKALHKDIADWMVETHFAQLPQPLIALKKWLGEGWKGYHELRGRKLIHLFEDEFNRIAAGPKKHTMVFYDRRKKYGDELDIASLDDPEQKDLREKFHREGHILLSRLIELAFDLDFED